VLADARPPALLALASYAVVLTDARPARLLAVAFSAVVLADARPAVLLALASYDARPDVDVAPSGTEHRIDTLFGFSRQGLGSTL
jgi:hypothetical protein